MIDIKDLGMELTLEGDVEIKKEIALEMVHEARLKLNKVVSFINAEEKEFPILKREEAVKFDALLTSLGIDFNITETKKRIIFQLA